MRAIREPDRHVTRAMGEEWYGTADVLYLSTGRATDAVEFDETAEGHHLRYNHADELIGVTIVGARRIFRRTGEIVVSAPLKLDVDELETVLTRS